MAKIIWEVGDCFESAEGIGVVLGSDNIALIVEETGSCRAATYTITSIPGDAKIVNLKDLKYELQQILTACLTVARAAQSGILNK